MPEAFSTLGIAAMYVAVRMGTAISPAAVNVRRNASAVIASTERSQALFGDKANAISQVWSIVKEHATENWNEDAAQPVDELAGRNATEFVRLLPPDFPMPEFSADPDGAISLDWIESRHRLLSVSVGADNRLPYAWLDGANRGHAVAVFDGQQIPDRLLAEIRKLKANGDTAVRST